MTEIINSEDGSNFQDLSADGRIILKYILQKYSAVM
jgi:hypothetical protein